MFPVMEYSRISSMTNITASTIVVMYATLQALSDGERRSVNIAKNKYTHSQTTTANSPIIQHICTIICGYPSSLRIFRWLLE